MKTNESTPWRHWKENLRYLHLRSRLRRR